jgi:hypothetical protein
MLAATSKITRHRIPENILKSCNVLETILSELFYFDVRIKLGASVCQLSLLVPVLEDSALASSLTDHTVIKSEELI